VKTKKVLLLVGTRPEVIKMAPVFHALKTEPTTQPIFCVTGQHDSMLTQALTTFEIVPSANLSVMKPGQSLSELTAQILLSTTELLENIYPDVLLVHGDTTTAFASTLASFYMNVEVGHVESGLRTHDLRAPFPEEVNRQLIARVSKWNFAPTSQAASNLDKEGVSRESIFVTGNTVVDSLEFMTKKFRLNKSFRESVSKSINDKLGFDFTRRTVVLITAHRRENLGEGISQICLAVKELSQLYPHISFIFPMHPNPLVRANVTEILDMTPNVKLIEPLPYSELVFILMQAALILTDSGGMQEEGVSLGKQVIVLRDKTERPEGIDSGLLSMVGIKSDLIVDVSQQHLDGEPKANLNGNLNSTYGDGRAASRIAKVVATGSTENWQATFSKGLG
jgi:UDP-N-acetylglucosamine 2-epimerase (non-hydrolysing)